MACRLPRSTVDPGARIIRLTRIARLTCIAASRRRSAQAEHAPAVVIAEVQRALGPLLDVGGANAPVALREAAVIRSFAQHRLDRKHGSVGREVRASDEATDLVPFSIPGTVRGDEKVPPPCGWQQVSRVLYDPQWRPVRRHAEGRRADV